MKPNTHLIRAFITPILFSALLLAVTARAQIGSGWTQTTYTERFEYESNDVLLTISPPPSSFNNGSCEYDNTGGVETFQLLNSHSNRGEIRFNDDYSSSSRQFQADVLVSAPSSDECIHQVFNGSTAPYLLLREETNNGGSLKIALHSGGGPSGIGTNLIGTWFRINSINSLIDGNTYIYLNGALVWSGANPGGTFYTKYGCYGTLTTPNAKIQFKNVKIFNGGNTNAAQVAAPTFSPGAGTYTNAQSVAISSTTGGASIRYTTDGSTPSETSGILYSSPVSITNTTSLKAIAYETGFLDSSVSSATYTINYPQVAAPSFNPIGGNYIGAQSVSITTTTGGASIRYTTDGSTPSETHGTLYSGLVNISVTTTLKAIAYESGYLDSGIAMGTYNISAGGLPSGWANTDIGAVGLAGSATYNAGAFTLQGGGTDIWGTVDAFNYSYQPFTNDFSITARVVSQTSTNAWAKSGVMIRETTAAGSAFAAVYVTPGSGVSMQCRTATGVAAVDLVKQTGVMAPYWVALVRSGDVFTGFSSPDGNTWTQIASTNISMAANVEVGLNVCAHDNTTLDTATFDNVDLGAPSQFSIAPTAVSASSTYGSYWPSNTVDGNLGTRWTSAGTNQWIQYDLGSTNLVSAVDLAFYAGTNRLYYFGIAVGNSASGPWTTVINNTTNSGTTVNLETYDFPATYGRYVRILCNAGNHDNYNNITETEVWGY
jgi:regulation of enolase protein 1 (concanavalin A-like superfamily)